MVNPFSSLIDSVSSMFKKSAGPVGSVLGIDIGSSSVKIVQLRNKNGKAVLETYGAIALGPYVDAGQNNGKTGVSGQVTNLSPQIIAKAVADLMKASSTTTNNGTVSIASSSSLVFLLELPPSLDKKDYASIIPTEARRYIPVPITEVSLDWWVIPDRVYEDVTDDSMASIEDHAKRVGPTEVIVAAIHNDALTKYRDIVKELSLQTQNFEIEMFSAVRACMGQDLTLTAVLDLGAAKTKLSIVERGIIHDFHIVNKGVAEITSTLASMSNLSFEEAEALKKEQGLSMVQPGIDAKKIATSHFDYIFTDISDVLAQYEKKHNRAIEKIILTGGGALTKGLLEHANEKLDYEVVNATPFGRTEAPEFLRDVLAETGPEFSIAVGLALQQLQQ
jgi:type IV pilus assembly protein PilM